MSTQVVSFHYTLKDKSGKVLESSEGAAPVVYLEGAGQIIPGLESELTGLKKGDKKTVNVKAKDGYGEHDSSLIMTMDKSELPSKNIKVGQQFRGEAHDGHHQVFVVTAVTDKEVTLDGNHPLAGQDLTFEVQLVERREATKEELAHGHAHGPDGHHHH
ncbi:MAG: peptidylprolyl isomerase [Oligoflexia bacterium]|nr:peptidylprolyl isomerase [Oligoflexia bacterium]